MAGLGPEATAAGHRLECVAEIGSTNAALVARARDGDAGPLWLCADVQVAGRGRNARDWVSPAGNLYVSVLLADPCPPAHLAELSFVMALALRDGVLAAAGLYDAGGLRLKWPNDLMADGLKAAGLLLEGGTANGRSFVVAGFGVNIVTHPEGTAHKATHLQAAGLQVTRDGVLAALGDALVGRLAQWARGANFSAIRAQWLQKAYGIGGPLRVTTATETFEGRFVDLDPAGRLIVHTVDGLRTVSSADVFVLPGTTGEYAA